MSKIKGKYDRQIDLKVAEKLAMAGANGVQMAAYFGVSPETLYRRVVIETEYDEFSVWLGAKRAKGDQLLLTKQYDVAMTGDRTMLVWLGKQRLNQSDKQHTVHEIPEKVNFSVTFRNGDHPDPPAAVQHNEPKAD